MKKIAFFVICVLSMALCSVAQSTTKVVDLGLSVKWADRNLGASSPQARGNYYKWGGKTPVTKQTSTMPDVVCVGNNLSAAYDAATAKLGANWRMPTFYEMVELMNKCKWTWTSKEGQLGFVVTGPNGNSIFLPAAGWTPEPSEKSCVYWTSTDCNFSDRTLAPKLIAGPAFIDVYPGSKYAGCSIRPVYTK